MDPKLVLKMIKAMALKASTDKPTSMAHLVELEDLISILRGWIDNGGYVPDDLVDDRVP